jgi:hypothetical protein
MNETNLLNLIKPWLNNIYQITTKRATVSFCKKKLDLNRPESTVHPRASRATPLAAAPAVSHAARADTGLQPIRTRSFCHRPPRLTRRAVLALPCAWEAGPVSVSDVARGKASGGLERGMRRIAKRRAEGIYPGPRGCKWGGVPWRWATGQQTWYPQFHKGTNQRRCLVALNSLKSVLQCVLALFNK